MLDPKNTNFLLHFHKFSDPPFLHVNFRYSILLLLLSLLLLLLLSSLLAKKEKVCKSVGIMFLWLYSNILGLLLPGCRQNFLNWLSTATKNEGYFLPQIWISSFFLKRLVFQLPSPIVSLIEILWLGWYIWKLREAVT